MAEKAPAKKRAPAKQQMLDALAETEKLVEEKRQADVRHEDRIEQRAVQEAVAAADSLSTDGIVRSISDLRAAVGKTLAQLSDKLEEEVGKYVQIKRAILAKEAELKEIYEIQKSASTLAALIETQERRRDEFDREMKAQKEELTREIESQRTEWEQERRQHEVETKERDSAEQKRREREKEEYRYSFAREQQVARDQFADEMAKAHKELAEKTAAAERDIRERERVVAEREQELGTLRQRVEQSPKELEIAVSKAVKDAATRAAAESSAREELLKNQFAGERNVLTTRISSLEHLVKEQAEQISRLAGQAEKAYTQVQDIAVKAIEGSSNFKSMTSLQQLLSEQGRRVTNEK
jgi:hypothetical protein